MVAFFPLPRSSPEPRHAKQSCHVPGIMNFPTCFHWDIRPGFLLENEAGPSQVYLDISFLLVTNCHKVDVLKDFPGGSVVKNPPASAGDTGSAPGLERSPGVGNGKPLQYACLGNPTNRGRGEASGLSSMGLQELDMILWLHCNHVYMMNAYMFKYWYI